MPGRSFPARSAIVIAIAILLAFPILTPFSSAGTVWSEGATEFASGTREKLDLGPAGLSLAGVNGTVANQWTRLAYGDPARRYGSATAYDSARDEVVLFGGEGMPGALGDTWSYNYSLNNWTNRNPSVAPSARYGHAMVYDSSRGQVILFGGSNGSYLCDTWTYDLGTNLWIDKEPSNAPPGRYEHAMAYDSLRGEVIMYGGYAGATLYNDTWAYNPGTNTWTKKAPAAAPSPRYFHAMAYDRIADRVLLFGGYHGILPAMVDTWSYDPGAGSWTELFPAGPPAGRYSHTMAYDSLRGEVILFGGYLGTWPLLGDTWTYNYTAGIWTNRNPPDAPTARYEQTMAYDSLRHIIVLFGGLNSTYLGDTWAYDGATNGWTDRKPAAAPSARYDSAMAYDYARDRVVLFGGFDGYDHLNDTWSWDPRTDIWTNMSPPSAPPARSEHALAYDEAGGAVVLYGGYNGSNLGDTWKYDPGNNTWTNMSPAGAPPARRDPAMVYDARHGACLMVGGSGAFMDNLTWTYNLSDNTWRDQDPPMIPAAGYHHAIAYDEAHGVTVLFGGGYDFGDGTYTYDMDTNKWTDMHPERRPPGRYGHAMSFDRSSGGVILFGGFGYSRILGDTWTYDYDTNNWTELSPRTPPSVRYSHSMALDTKRGAVLLFGGTGYNYLSDTWAYGRVELSPTGSFTSAPRDTGGAAYFGAISWTADLPAATTVKFQFRSADTRPNLLATAFAGPDGTAGAYYEASGLKLNSTHNGARWLQYRAYLSTTDISRTPILKTAAVSYNLLHNLEVVSPQPGDSVSGLRTISWTASDPDNDNLYFDIVLLDAKGQPSLLASNLTGRSWLWNTSLQAEGACKLRITARDDHPAIPLSVVAESGAFLITRAAVNHPPSATLISPANMSTAISGNVTLFWQGSDLDNDPIFYNLTWACGSFAQPNRPFIITQNISYALTDLPNGTTWFWAVAPYDGKEYGSMTPAWRFTVNISGVAPPNHPPRIISTPSLLAATDLLYVYNVVASDPDNDNLTFSLDSSVVGMAIDNLTGRLSWTPSTAGNYSVNVTATDVHGATDTQRFTLQVLAPGPRPVCIITFPPDGATISGNINITGFAVRGATPLDRVELRLDGGVWQEVTGLENWRIILNSTQLPNGGHLIEARARCGVNYSDIARAQLTVANPSSNGTPFGRTAYTDPFGCIILLLILLISIIFTFVYRANRQAKYQPAPPRQIPPHHVRRPAPPAYGRYPH